MREPSFYRGLFWPWLLLVLRGGIAYSWDLRSTAPGPGGEAFAVRRARAAARRAQGASVACSRTRTRARTRARVACVSGRGRALLTSVRAHAAEGARARTHVARASVRRAGRARRSDLISVAHW